MDSCSILWLLFLQLSLWIQNTFILKTVSDFVMFSSLLEWVRVFTIGFYLYFTRFILMFQNFDGIHTLSSMILAFLWPSYNCLLLLKKKSSNSLNKWRRVCFSHITRYIEARNCGWYRALGWHLVLSISILCHP